ncbi:MAG: MarR family transcriptional regulator [Lachnospiraceae bacterium]|nr:MarR family transcriptional regulator [Lachnospiraceae bacterium]
MNLEEYGVSKATFQTIIEYIDEVKELLSSEIWENVFLSSSKNEVLVFWLLYQKEEVNMTEIAAYIHVPLNTATGMVGRMEKKGLIERTRSGEDKRVVLIRFSPKGIQQFRSLVREMVRYGTRIFSELTEDEIKLFFKMSEKLKGVLKEDKQKEAEVKKVRKINIE